LERRRVRRWRGGSHRWWHRIFTYSSVNSVLFGTHSILLMRSPFSAMTLFFSPHKEEARAVDRPIFTTGSTYHPSLASSPTTMVPLPLPAIAYLCGPAVHFVLCFILQPEGAFDCPHCQGWCLSLCDAAVVARNACATTCCCCTAACCFCPLFCRCLCLERGVSWQ
jgi:hypothetical protein